MSDDQKKKAEANVRKSMNATSEICKNIMTVAEETGAPPVVVALVVHMQTVNAQSSLNAQGLIKQSIFNTQGLIKQSIFNTQGLMKTLKALYGKRVELGDFHIPGGKN